MTAASGPAGSVHGLQRTQKGCTSPKKGQEASPLSMWGFFFFSLICSKTVKRFCCWSGLRPRFKKQLGIYLHSIAQAQGRKERCRCHQPFGHWCLQGYGGQGKGRVRQAGSGALAPISSRVSVIGETDLAGVCLSLTPGALPPPRPTGAPPKSLFHVQRIFCLVKRLPRISQRRLGNRVCFPAFSGNGFGSEQGAQLRQHPPPLLGRPNCLCRSYWGAGVCGCL